MRNSESSLVGSSEKIVIATSMLAVTALFKIRQLKRELAESNRRVSTDELTGLPNRLGLKEILGREQSPVAVLMIDGTNQKAVNDKISHRRGDEAIIGTANILRNCLRENDFVARIGGDEFMVLLFKQSDKDGQRSTRAPEEQIDGAITRIESATTSFLDSNPDLLELGFDIAVGSTVWEAGQSTESLILAAEENMKLRKAQQHDQVGKYRP